MEKGNHWKKIVDIQKLAPVAILQETDDIVRELYYESVNGSCLRIVEKPSVKPGVVDSKQTIKTGSYENLKINK